MKKIPFVPLTLTTFFGIIIFFAFCSYIFLLEKYEVWLLPFSIVLGLMSIYVPIIFANRTLSITYKVLWIIGILLLTPIVTPLYWYQFVRGNHTSFLRPDFLKRSKDVK